VTRLASAPRKLVGDESNLVSIATRLFGRAPSHLLHFLGLLPTTSFECEMRTTRRWDCRNG
jgi:hypothetical protein